MVDRRRGRSTLARLGTLLIVLATGSLLSLLPAAPSAATASTTCGGRVLLTCAQKQAFFNAEIVASRSFVLDDVLFALKLPLGLSNRALAGFWRQDAAVGAALSFDEGIAYQQFPDSAFESTYTPPTLSVPKVSASRIVDRRAARALNGLIASEQTAAVDVGATVVSLDRATGASLVAGRQDWVPYQHQLAGRWASRAASALTKMIAGQRSVAKTFARLRLRFGISSVDLSLTKQRAKRSGLPGTLVAAMSRLGMDGQAIAFTRKAVARNPLAGTFVLGPLLASSSTLGPERALVSALRSAAADAPRGVPQPQ
jgi:hypothetical protein